MDDKERIKMLEKSLAPFAKLGSSVGFQADRADDAVALLNLAGTVTVGDFRRAAEALRQHVGAKPITPTY